MSWVRRTRVDGDSWASADAPLGEASEAYALDILSSAGAVLRSFSCSSASQLYTATQELADFGTAQTVLHLRVVQLSATVGKGWPAIVTLDL